MANESAKKKYFIFRIELFSVSENSNGQSNISEVIYVNNIIEVASGSKGQVKFHWRWYKFLLILLLYKSFFAIMLDVIMMLIWIWQER